MDKHFWAHPSALVESDSIGAGTRIWPFTHIMQGATIGEQCNIGEHVFIEAGAVLGNRVTVKNGVQIWEGVTLEDDVFVGPNAVFTNDRFPRSPRSEAAGGRYSGKQWLATTRIARGASIGANATILCGLDIGPYASVGAGAVVTKPAAPFTLVVGVPAVKVSYVCLCGHVLKNQRGSLQCSECRRSYVESADGLAQQD